MIRITLLPLAALVVSSLALSAWPSAVEAADLRDAGFEAYDDACCDEYYACIDTCAEEYAGDSDFCWDTYPRDAAARKGCLALADKSHEECLDECPERPPGC